MLWGVILLRGYALGSYSALGRCSRELFCSEELLWGDKICSGELLWGVTLGSYSGEANVALGRQMLCSGELLWGGTLLWEGSLLWGGNVTLGRQCYFGVRICSWDEMLL
ncbi:MAG TPA: hypothetical protein PLG16_06380 [Planctomycetota bacterium]|nr:hypothetical protein [Planctomycetota bacterium]